MVGFSSGKSEATVVARGRHGVALGVLMGWIAVFVLSSVACGLLLCVACLFGDLGYSCDACRLLDVLPSSLFEVRLR